MLNNSKHSLKYHTLTYVLASKFAKFCISYNHNYKQKVEDCLFYGFLILDVMFVALSVYNILFPLTRNIFTIILICLGYFCDAILVIVVVFIVFDYLREFNSDVRDAEYRFSNKKIHH